MKKLLAIGLACCLPTGLAAEDPADAEIPLTLRRHAGYDHGYYFVSTFMADQLRWHAAKLKA